MGNAVSSYELCSVSFPNKMCLDISLANSPDTAVCSQTHPFVFQLRYWWAKECIMQLEPT